MKMLKTQSKIFIISKLRNWQKLLAGGMAGVACWVSSYPLDSLKSNVQAKQYTKSLSWVPDGTILEESLNIHRKAIGYNGFFNGITAVMGRAFFASAIGFWLWECSKKHLQLDFLK